MNPKRVIFLDRDGTINRDSPDFIKNWAEFEFLPGSLAALAALTRAGCTLILITNQSAVGRGIVPQQTLDHTHSRLCAAVAAAGGRIEAIFFCPHRPEDNCDCRKPEPGLIRRACERYTIDPADTVMIGDSARDILCGRRAGCGKTILVRTGNGRDAEQALSDLKAPPDAVADDLLKAVGIIEAHFQPSV